MHAAPRERVGASATGGWFGSDLGAGVARVTVWGDYQDPVTRELDRRLRAALAGLDGIHYSYRNYPLDKACNPSLPRDMQPGSCDLSRAAIVAMRLGGQEGFRRMHEWLMSQEQKLDRAGVLRGARQVGFPEADFARELDAPETQRLLQADLTGGRAANLRAVPAFLVDDRRIPRWRTEGLEIPERLLATLAGDR